MRSGGPPAINEAACRAAKSWIAPSIPTLTPQQAAGILVGARETAKVKAAQETPPTADGVARPASSRFRPAMARLDFPLASSLQHDTDGADEPALGQNDLSAVAQNDEAAAQSVLEASRTIPGGAEAECTEADSEDGVNRPQHAAAGIRQSAFANSAKQGSPLIADSESAEAQVESSQTPTEVSGAIGSSWGLGSMLQALYALLGRLWWRVPAPAALELSQSQVLRRALSELNAFQLPHQTNRLALIFDPLDDEVMQPVLP